MVLCVVLGIVVMHGLGDPSMDHGSSIGTLVAAPAAHLMEPTPHHDHHLCPGGACGGSHSADMVMAGCAYAVVALSARPRCFLQPIRTVGTAPAPMLGGPSRGPEPPVPRFV